MIDPTEYLNINDCSTGKVVGTHTSNGKKNALKNKEIKDVFIPEKYLNVKITEIGYESFRETNIESVFISKYVKTILWCAFVDCSLLKYITFDPNSELTQLGTNSFLRTNIISFNFPSSFISLEKDASGYAPFYSISTLTCVSYLGTNDISFNYLFAYITSNIVAHSSSTYQYKIGNLNPVKDNMKCPEKDFQYLFPSRTKLRQVFYSCRCRRDQHYIGILIYVLIAEK